MAKAGTSLVAELTIKHFLNFAKRRDLCVFKNSTSSIARSFITICHSSLRTLNSHSRSLFCRAV